MSARVLAAAALAATLLAACSTTRVTLLPSPDGKVGAIAVLQDGKETILTSPYSTAQVSGSGAVQQSTLDAESARAPFTETLAALPPRPMTYMLYFVGDSDELTPASRDQASELLAQIAGRPDAEVVVTGHADRRHTREYNDKLSLARAAAVRDRLVALGFKAEQVSVVGRGERELAVQTADGVAEPRNRRVQITVR